MQSRGHQHLVHEEVQDPQGHKDEGQEQQQEGDQHQRRQRLQVVRAAVVGGLRRGQHAPRGDLPEDVLLAAVQSRGRPACDEVQDPQEGHEDESQ